MYKHNKAFNSELMVCMYMYIIYLATTIWCDIDL